MVFRNGDGSGAIMFRDVFSFTDLAAPTGGLTNLTPALTFHDRTLHMGHHDIRNSNLWHSIFDQSSQTWSQKRIEGQSSFAPPALASFNGRLHMVHVGESSNQIWHSVFDGDQWSPNIKVPKQSSKDAPALAAFNGSLHMVHTGDSSNQLWHSQFQDD